MKTSKKKCSACKGWGHDKGGRPEVRFVEVQNPETGKVERKHRTIKQGSGCPNCGGLGVK